MILHVLQPTHKRIAALLSVLAFYEACLTAAQERGSAESARLWQVQIGKIEAALSEVSCSPSEAQEIVDEWEAEEFFSDREETAFREWQDEGEDAQDRRAFERRAAERRENMTAMVQIIHQQNATLPPHNEDAQDQADWGDIDYFASDTQTKAA